MVLFHEGIAVVLVGGVAIVSLALAILAARAQEKSGNAKLGYVKWAFALFCVKSLVTGYALLQDPSQSAEVPADFPLGHGHLEFLNSAFDLGIVLLLVAPFLRRS